MAVYDDSIFEADLPDLLSRLDEAKDGGLKAVWLSWTSASVKAAKKRVVELRKGSSVALSQAWTELNDIYSLRQNWEKDSGGASIPFSYPGLEELEKAGAAVRRDVQELQRITGRSNWEKLSFDKLGIQVAPFAGDFATPYRMLTLSGI